MRSGEDLFQSGAVDFGAFHADFRKATGSKAFGHAFADEEFADGFVQQVEVLAVRVAGDEFGALDGEAFEAVDGQESRAPATGGDRLEAYCLSVLACHPDLVAQTDRQLRLLGLPPLTAEDFLDTDVQIIFRALKAALDQDQIDPQEHMIANLDEMAETRVRLWLAASDDAAVADQRRVDDIMLAVLRLRKRNIGSELLELRFLQEEAQTDAAVSELYQSQIVTLVQSLQKVTHGLAKNSRRMDRVGDAGVK